MLPLPGMRHEMHAFHYWVVGGSVAIAAIGLAAAAWFFGGDASPGRGA